MKRLLSVVVAALIVAGCQVEPATSAATVLSVQEHKQMLPEDLLKFDDDNLRFPEVAWQVEVELKDGSRLSATHTGARRYMPGERVRVIVDEDGALLL